MADAYNPLYWVPPAKEKQFASVVSLRLGKTRDGKLVIPRGKGKDKDKGDTKDKDKGDTGGGSSGGGGGGGGGSADTGQQYIEAYRLKFFPRGNPPAALLAKAKANNWSVAYFEQRVRLKDPKYYRSVEARTLLPEFGRVMKVLFPGLTSAKNQKQLMKTAFYKRNALWYLKNGIGLLGDGGAEMLYNRITNTKRWKLNNPSYRQYVRNKTASVQAEANPVVYKQLQESMKSAFKEAGIKVADDYYKSFFSSRYASSEGVSDMVKNLSSYVQTQPASTWYQGEAPTRKVMKQAVFGGDVKATDLRSRLARQFQTQQSFISDEPAAYQTAMNKQEKLVQPTL